MQNTNEAKSFLEAFGFQALLHAHFKCRRSKGHKREVVAFELKLGQNLVNLSNSILNGTYQICHYRNFEIFEPKQRNIESLSYKHRLVQYCMCKNILEPLLERRLIFSNAACRVGKGTDFARKFLERGIVSCAKKHKNAAYFLKCDVKKYFASINHEILIELLSHLPVEAKTLNLLKIIVNSHNFDSGVGIPIGNQTSQWFALLYLNKIDRLIKEQFRCPCYVRYMDDLVLISPDRAYLADLKQAIINKGKELKIEFNAKTKITSFKTGVSFLGFLYKVGNNGELKKLIKQQTKKKLKKAFRVLRFYFFNHLVDRQFVLDRLTCYKNYYRSFYGRGIIKKLCHLNLKEF